MTQTLSIKDTRDKLADILNQVSVAGDMFVITKFGKPTAMIVPVTPNKLGNSAGIEESFGGWKGKKDIKETNSWVSDLRTKMSKRAVR